MSKWTVNDMPDQTGRVAIVTGANSGLGYESALALASKGAEVIMAVRNMTKGEQAVADIKAQHPSANLVLMELDLGSLDSVHQFAEEYKSQYDRLDILMNNAGIMAVPQGTTEDGFEKQLGVNHLGHFALTGLLLDVILATPSSRVVNVTSTANYMGDFDFDDLMLEENYSRYGAYGNSKLANVMFTFELQRRLDAAGASTISNTAHPGLAATQLQVNTTERSGNAIESFFYHRFFMPVFSQSQAKGALPQLYAATAPDAEPAAYYGPDFFQMRGYPKEFKANSAAYNADDAKRLWDMSEELTGVTYNFEMREKAFA
jgi:NAD(P)-dependent dehydrogenase (short-subunit alcohol dehydrogenase family)